MVATKPTGASSAPSGSKTERTTHLSIRTAVYGIARRSCAKGWISGGAAMGGVGGSWGSASSAGITHVGCSFKRKTTFETSRASRRFDSTRWLLMSALTFTRSLPLRLPIPIAEDGPLKLPILLAVMALGGRTKSSIHTTRSARSSYSTHTPSAALGATAIALPTNMRHGTTTTTVAITWDVYEDGHHRCLTHTTIRTSRTMTTN